jgi:hypothetical protein
VCQVHDKVKSAGLFDGQIRRLSAFENLIDIDRSPSAELEPVGVVGQQTPSVDVPRRLNIDGNRLFDTKSIISFRI